MKLISPGDTYTEGFSTSGSSGAANADSTPTVALYRNGTVDGAVTVTVANVATGAYKLSCTIPVGYAAGDEITFLVVAVVGGNTYRGWTETFTLVASDAAGHLRVTIKDGSGAGELNLTNGAVDQVLQVIEVGNTLTLETLADGIITASKLASGAITAAKIADGALTPAKFAVNPSVESTVSGSGGTTTSFVAAAGLSAQNDYYKDQLIVFLSGPNAKVARPISAYAGSTRTFTFESAWPIAPEDGNTFIIIGYVPAEG